MVSGLMTLNSKGTIDGVKASAEEKGPRPAVAAVYRRDLVFVAPKDRL